MKPNPKHLRIGKFLHDEISKELMVVDVINQENIEAYIVDRSKYPLPDGWYMTYIPLTEEWLLKFGLKKERDWKFLFSNNNEMFIWSNRNEDFNHTDKNYFSFALQGEGFHTMIGKCFSFVHELQNLYFALTSNELKIVSESQSGKRNEQFEDDGAYAE